MEDEHGWQMLNESLFLAWLAFLAVVAVDVKRVTLGEKVKASRERVRFV